VSAAARCIELNELIGLLRHDLDWIVMKAEERDRERRYGSPSDLAADLRRYLRNEPVTARPPSTLYQLGKFIRRRRIAAAFSAAIALLAILASGAGIIAVRQRNIALMEQGSADRTARFMVSLFQLADPDVNRGNSVTVREVLDRGAAQVDHNLADEPAIRADLLTAMGQAYAGLGLYDPAKKLLGDARADQTHAAVPAESRVRTLAASGRTLYLAADYADAEPLLRQAVDLGRRELPADDPLRAEALDALAEELVQLRRYAEAEKLCDEALADDRRRGPAGAASTARTLDTLGVAYFFGNDLPAAESTWRQALDLHQHVSGDRDAATAQAMNNLGAVLYQSGRIRDAVDMYRESLRVLHAVYGENHPEVAVLLHNLGNATLMLGQIDEAEPLLRQALAMTEKFKGGNHDDLVPPLNMLAMIDEYAGRTAEAQAEIRRAEQIARLPNHGVLLDEVLLNLADLALESGHADQAAAALAESRRLLEAAYPLTRNPGEAWRYALWDTVNAKFLAQRGDSKSAKRIVDAALPVIERRFERNGFNSLLARRRAQAVARAVPQV
jgi:tetratricopeptide (TPR) repeat protein